MNEFSTTELQKLPGTGSLMRKALFASKPGLPRGEALPTLSNRIAEVGLDSKRLQKMHALCEIPQDGVLPPTALHILAAPLHIALLTDARFPIKAMGIVHASNEIRCLRPVEPAALVKMSCRIGETRWKPKGLEFDLLTQALMDGETVWEEVTTIFSRVSDDVAKAAAAERRPSNPDPIWDDAEEVVWSLPGNLGRSYAAIAGDRNPIHMYRWTAKLFGFSRPIIHGMYLLARALGALEVSGHGTRNQITFKRPVPLPGRVRFQHRNTTDGTEFRLLREKVDKVLLEGFVRQEA